jgi:hypothetical protein
MAGRKTGALRSRRSVESGDLPQPGNGELRTRISLRAYELFLARGGEHGRDLEDWLEAERQVMSRDAGQSREDQAIAPGAPLPPRDAVRAALNR